MATRTIARSSRRSARDEVNGHERVAAEEVGVKARIRAAGVAAMLALLVLPASVNAGSPTFHYREFAQGANVIFSPNCPFGDWAPSTDTICDEYTVWYVRFATTVDGGPLGRSTAAFHAEIDHERDLVHPDNTGEPLSLEFGVADVAGSYDESHLTSAHMEAVSVPMMNVDPVTGAITPNGTTDLLGAFRWTAASGIYRYGNDGPAFALSGPRHIQSPCLTLNRLAHQKDSVGYVTGSVNGVPLSADYQDIQIPGLSPADGTGYIFDNWFHVNRVQRPC